MHYVIIATVDGRTMYWGSADGWQFNRNHATKYSKSRASAVVALIQNDPDMVAAKNVAALPF